MVPEIKMGLVWWRVQLSTWNVGALAVLNLFSNDWLESRSKCDWGPEDLTEDLVEAPELVERLQGESCEIDAVPESFGELEQSEKVRPESS